jgi:hypothetical protein
MSYSETTTSAEMSRPLLTTMTVQAHRAEEQCLLEGQEQNTENFLRLLGGTGRLTISKRKVQDLRPRETCTKKWIKMVMMMMMMTYMIM